MSDPIVLKVGDNTVIAVPSTLPGAGSASEMAAAASALAASGFADDAAASAAASLGAVSTTEAARDITLAAIAAPPAGTYATHAALVVAMLAGSLTADAYYRVIADEVAGEAQALYQYKTEAIYTTGLVATGKLVYQATLSGSVNVDGLPQGVAGYWRARDYVTTVDGLPAKVVPNRAATSQPEALISRIPSGSFKNTGAQARQWLGFPNTAALVMTDNAEIGPDGFATASTIVGTGGDQYLSNQSQTLPSGTNTFAVWLRSRTGVNQNLRISGNNANTYTAIVVTPIWQRFTVSWTDGAVQSGKLRIANDGAAAWNVAVAHAKAYQNATAPADKLLGGHLYVGFGHADTAAPTVASGWINLTSFAGASATCEWSEVKPTREITISMLVDAPTGGVADNSYLFVDNLAQTVNGMRDVDPNPATDDTHRGNWTCHLGGAAVPKTLDLGRSVLGRGPHVITCVISTNKLYVYVDDVQFSTLNLNASPTAVATRVWRMGAAAGLTNNYKVNQLALWWRALSPAEVRKTFKVFASVAMMDGIAVVPPQSFVVFEGDSLPSYNGPGGVDVNNSWCDLFREQAASHVWVDRRSISGSVYSGGSINLTARAADVDDSLPPLADRAGRKFVYGVHCGTNDMVTQTDTACLANANANAIARKAAGWKVVASTMLAISGNATYNARRTPFNVALRASVNFDAIADLAADTNIGDDADAGGPNFGDTIHLNTAGHAIAGPIWNAVLNPLV